MVRSPGRVALATWLLASLSCASLACGLPPEQRVSGVILVVVDTLRADRLSAYGNLRATSPVFDRLARRGVLFEQAISPSSWTLPSLIGLLTGRFPSAEAFQHGRMEGSAIELLREAGVRTAAFTEAGFASERFGFAQGFEIYRERNGKVALADSPGPAGDTTETISLNFADAERFLRAQGDERFFLWIHTYEPHTPYQRGIYIRDLDPGVRESYAAALRRAQRGELELTDIERAYIASLYDGGVRVSDAHIGRLLRALRDTGRDRSTALIVTSDHGEDLGERASRDVANHGHSLYDDLIRVPLLVYDPSRRYPRRRIATQVSTLDVAPTVLDLLGVEQPESLDGRSLVPVMLGHETAHRLAFSHVHRKGPSRISVRDGRFKLIRELNPEGDRNPEVYDLVADPGETRDLGAGSPETRRSLERKLGRFRAELMRRGPLDFSLREVKLPSVLRRQLGALGYLGEEGSGAVAGSVEGSEPSAD